MAAFRVGVGEVICAKDGWDGDARRKERKKDGMAMVKVLVLDRVGVSSDAVTRPSLCSGALPYPSPPLARRSTQPRFDPVVQCGAREEEKKVIDRGYD